ncbi:hypothetical protein BC833DRAFT_567746 [Globomyces pollinis-pini]|nr:hypothetical protein BC833DRAFT_567746 [Globomyces pollinis-pini]
MTVEKSRKSLKGSFRLFNAKYSKIVGVACGTRFPDSCREEAHRLGLMVVYPSGSRYRVDGKCSSLSFSMRNRFEVPHIQPRSYITDKDSFGMLTIVEYNLHGNSACTPEKIF